MLLRTLLTTLATFVTTFAAAQAQQRQPGLLVRLYDIGRGVHQIPELAPSQLPNVVKVIPTLELRSDRGDFRPFEGNFYTQVTGLLTIDQPGKYTFRLISDDGSILWIDDQLVVNHDGLHGAVPRDREIALTAGEHKLRVTHFESGGEEHLELQWRPPGAEPDKFELIPATALTHDADVSRETSPGRKRIIPPLRRGLPGDGTPVQGMHPSFRLNFYGTGRLNAEPGSFKGLPYEDLQLVAANSEPSPQRPFIWLPPAAVHSQPPMAPLNLNAYEGQFLVSKNRAVNQLFRLFLEKSDTHYQGGFVQFANFERGILGIGIDAAGQVWTGGGLEQVGNHKLDTTRQDTFEMLVVRAMTNGFEIEFTKPLDPRCGWDPESYYIEQWPFRMGSDEATERRSDEGTGATGSLLPVREDTGGQAARGTRRDTAQEAVPHRSEPEASATGQSEPEAQARAHPPRRDGIRYPVKSASVSPDRKKVFLEIDDLKESHVVYIRLLPPCYSEDGERPWSTEAWYTLNVIPQDRYGKVLTPPEPQPQNFLTEEEKAAGWKLLFDGKTPAGWRGYKKDRFPDGWIVTDGCLVRVGPGGDICTVEQFDNFELKLEWRIAAAGNSGIFFRVDESLGWPWESGPEMQVLDNAEHADGRNPLTSAGSNYALHAPVRDVTAPVGFFNQVRIVADGPHVEYWLNDVKIIEYEFWTNEWKQLVANSKFKAWPNYGLVRKGHIVLQDHGDRVWYRNIKIRPLAGK